MFLAKLYFCCFTFEAYLAIFRHIQDSDICKHAIFRILAYLEPEASPKACRICKMIKHIQRPDIVITVYSCIFKDIQGYTGILMHMQPQKCPDFVQLWVKFSVQNIVLRVDEKTLKCFPVGPFFLVFLSKMFIKMHQFPETSPALKNIWLCICIQTFFLQNASS